MTSSPPSDSATQAEHLTAPRPALSAPGLSVWAPSQRALTAGLVSTVTLVAFEALAVGTVMPLVAGELGGISLYGWAFSGFFLGNLVGIVAAGSAIDRSGVRGPLLAGLGLFAIGLVIGGLAPSMPILVLGRIVQGAGAGAIPGVAYVTIANSYDESVRPRMFAILSSAWVVPGLVGPAIAGWIGDHITWRAVFLGLLPMILVAGSVTLRALVRSTNLGSARPAAAKPEGAASVGLAANTSRPRWPQAGACHRRGARGRASSRGNLGWPGVVDAGPGCRWPEPRCRRTPRASTCRHVARRTGIAGGRPGSRHPHLRLLRGGRVSAPRARHGARNQRDRGWTCADRGHPFMDGRIVDPGEPQRGVGRPPARGPRLRAGGRVDRDGLDHPAARRAHRCSGRGLGDRRVRHGPCLLEPFLAGTPRRARWRAGSGNRRPAAERCPGHIARDRARRSHRGLRHAERPVRRVRHWRGFRGERRCRRAGGARQPSPGGSASGRASIRSRDGASDRMSERSIAGDLPGRGRRGRGSARSWAPRHGIWAGRVPTESGGTSSRSSPVRGRSRRMSR